MGEYSYRDVNKVDGIPAIVPKELFERVQEQLAKNKKSSARRKAEDDYLWQPSCTAGNADHLWLAKAAQAIRWKYTVITVVWIPRKRNSAIRERSRKTGLKSYEDKIIFTCNYKDGSKTITLAEVEGSDLSVFGALNQNLGVFKDKDFRDFFFVWN